MISFIARRCPLRRFCNAQPATSLHHRMYRIMSEPIVSSHRIFNLWRPVCINTGIDCRSLLLLIAIGRFRHFMRIRLLNSTYNINFFRREHL